VEKPTYKKTYTTPKYVKPATVDYEEEDCGCGLPKKTVYGDEKPSVKTYLTKTLTSANAGTVKAAKNFKQASSGKAYLAIPDVLTKDIEVQNGNAKKVNSCESEKDGVLERAFKVRGFIEIDEGMEGEWKMISKGKANASNTQNFEKLNRLGDGEATVENPCEECPFKGGEACCKCECTD